jgi:hypothetical protein
VLIWQAMKNWSQLLSQNRKNLIDFEGRKAFQSFIETIRLHG